MTNSLLALILAAALGLLFTPLARALAWKLDFLDRPSSPLKNQARPVAYLGGAALALAFGLSLLAVKFTRQASPATGLWPLGLEKGRGVYALGLGGLLALGLGLLDDARALKPGWKFLGQLAAAGLLVLFGLRVRFPHQVWLEVPLTLLWVVALTNALNFVDILDGLAASLAAAAALVFWAFAAHAGRGDVALAAAALAGACLGFLPYNWRPARIYMGDAGSHFLGFTLAAISLNLSYSHQNALAVFSPLAILFVPLFDLGLMVLIRLRRGQAPWVGSPDHVALRLGHLGLSAPRVALSLAGLTLVLGGLVYAASFLSLGSALLFWAGLALAAVLAAAWLMSVPMPHEQTAPPKRRRQPQGRRRT